MNTYGYVGGNPLYFIDPYGLSQLARTISTAPLAFPATTPDGDHIIYSNPIQDINEALTVLHWNILVGITKMCADRVENPTKSDSPVWNGDDLKPDRGGRKNNGKKGKKKELYEWDHTHNDIEVYDGRGKHKGSMDPTSGDMIKPPVPGRTIDL